MTESRDVKSVLQHYLQRLQEAINRSPLLNAWPGKMGSGSKLDLTDLDRFGEGAAVTLIDRVLNRGAYRIYPRRHKYYTEEDVEELGRDQVRIFRQMERHLIRTADKIERETGNRSLWLGYPLLYLTAPSDPKSAVLAPIFLWPIRVRIDRSRPLCVEVEFDKQADAPSLNGIMKAWIKTKWGFALSEFGTPTSREDLTSTLDEIFAELNDLDIEQATEYLRSISRKKEIPPEWSPRILNAGVMGVMRWHNQALMDDIQDLLLLDEFESSLPVFLTGRASPEKKPATYENEEDRHLVTAADYSQESVIVQARSGPGVIVHGPPGTGKSQTITNMVADTLARGETVLVVCQKRAAIDVVSSNLKAVGLSNLFITVHDVVSDREPIIDVLKNQLEELSNSAGRSRRGITSQGTVRNSQGTNIHRKDLCNQIEDLESELESAYYEFHSDRPCGMSFSQIMGRLIKLGSEYSDETSITSEIGALFRSCRRNDLHATLKEIRVLGRLYEQCEPDKNPWQYRRPDFDLTPETRRLFEEVVNVCITESRSHDEFCSERGIGLQIDRPTAEYRQQSKVVLDILGSILDHPDLKYILAAYANIHENETARDAYKTIIQLSKHIQERSMDRRIERLYKSAERDECLETIEIIRGTREFEHNWLRILNSTYRVRKRQLRPKLLEKGLAWTWEELKAIEETLRGRFDRERLDDLLGIFSSPDATSPESDDDRVVLAKRIEGWLHICLKLQTAAKDLQLAAGLHKSMCNSAIVDLRRERNHLEVVIDRCSLVDRSFQTIEHLEPFLTVQCLNALKNHVSKGQKITTWLERLRDGLETINQLYAYDSLYDRLNERDRNLVDLLVKAQCGERAQNCSITVYWEALTELAALGEWRKEAATESPILKTNLEDSLGTVRNDLRESLLTKFEVESAALLESWHHQSLDATDQNWKRFLRKRGVGARRLREIVHRGQKLGIFKLRPCWLTNPETASQILPLEEGLFDLVIFDEASQLPLEQAAPSIYRAKRVVVAGDEHQLPPTSFFKTASNVEEDAIPVEPDDEEDADAIQASASLRREGLELAYHCTDLLELSKYVLPDKYLKIHYRSRHPGLIMFSNWAFYRGQLEAAHPVWGTPTEDTAPIRFHPVQGIYDQRTRTNQTEALYIVRLLRHLWTQSTEVPTIGVVTFNKQQEDLIEEELLRSTATDHAFRALLDRERKRKSGAKDVGFFVKNLESVQGDERDLIVFSTTFGPTVPGDESSFKRYFGPLTQNGGERRLNVAVTRARYAVIVVSSMLLERISDIHNGIEPGRTIKARDFLHAYMGYASSVSIADFEGMERWLGIAAKLGSGDRTDVRLDGVLDFDSEFEEQVYERLIQAGWHVETQVGSQGFKIDLAVRHPDPTKGYLLGIECDGATYHSNFAARVHDIWREDILKQYGWKIHRIWSTQWWTFPDRIMAELCALLESLCEEHQAKPDFQPPPTLREVPVTQTVDLLREAPLVDEVTETTAAETDVEPTFSADPVEWVKQFEILLIQQSQDEGEIASWRDEDNHLFEILLTHRRAIPMLFLQREGEEFGHFSVRAADPTVLQEASERLGRMRCHADVLDWFEWLHRNLHPDLWSST